MQKDINLLENAIKAGYEDPFFILTRRCIVSRKTSPVEQLETLTNFSKQWIWLADNEDFDISWDENDIVRTRG